VQGRDFLAALTGLTAVQGQQRYQQIVDRFDEVARADLGAVRHISDICEAIAINQRTLSRAFHAIHGTTPLCHLHALRLAEARKALLLGDARSENVTQVAMRFGFRELGRFAVDYRAAFGESPSQTLAAAMQKRQARRSADGRD